jgi:hypothetical protein
LSLQSDLLLLGLKANVPTLLWGAPGVGKTSNIYGIAKHMNAHLETLIASIREPTDFGGLPIRTGEGEVTLAPMGWAKRIREANDRGQLSIVFIDEISTAPPANQAALLRVSLDKVVGDLDLVGANPDMVRMVAAANPPELAAGGWDLAAPLANRWFHVQWTADPKEWVNGYLMGWPKPNFPAISDDWEEGIEYQKSMTAGYIMSQPQDLVKVPADENEAGTAWPSPRSWVMMDKLLTAANAANLKEHQLAIITGSVGKEVGHKYYTYIRDLDLPNADELLSNPDSFVLPQRADQTYAVLTAVVSHVTRAGGQPNKERYLAAWKILSKAAEQSSIDIACGAAKNLGKWGIQHNMPDTGELIDPFIPILREAGVL